MEIILCAVGEFEKIMAEGRVNIFERLIERYGSSGTTLQLSYEDIRVK